MYVCMSISVVLTLVPVEYDGGALAIVLWVREGGSSN